MKKIIILTGSLLISSVLFSSCDKPDELTPATDGNSETFLIPTGSILTAQEREEVQASWDEYNTAINQ